MSDITTGYSFRAGEKNVNHTKLNQALNSAVINASFLSGKSALTGSPDKTTTVLLAYDGTSLRKISLSSGFLDHDQLVHSRTQHTTALAADELLVADSATTYALKRITLKDAMFSAAEFTSAIAFDDLLPFYDASGTTINRLKVGNLFWKLPARAGALVATDELPIVNTGGTTAEKVTVNQLFTAPNILTSKTTLQDNDRVAIYDTAGTAAKAGDLKSVGIVHRGLVDSSSGDAYVWTFAPKITALYTGLRVCFPAAAANSGAASLNPDGLGVKTIKKHVTQDLVTNDVLAGQMLELVYDGTNFQLIGASPILVTADQNLLGAAGTIQVAHGLGVVPRFVRWVLVAQATPGNGYTAGDELDIFRVGLTGLQPGLSSNANATNLELIQTAADTALYLVNRSAPSATGVTFTSGKWKARCYYAP